MRQPPPTPQSAWEMPRCVLGLSSGYEANAWEPNATFQIEISWWAYLFTGNQAGHLLEVGVIQVLMVSLGYHWWL